jgi:GTP-binding protein
MKLPLVVLCGRPNVGKSTLFNRLTRSREALVHDLPGMTRDRTYGRVEILDVEGKVDELFECVDTGGLDFEGSDLITQGITRMADQALEEAQVICFIVDGHDGCTSADEEIAGRLQRTGKPVLLVINKVDGMKGGSPDAAFYRFGFKTILSVSASHGEGIQTLLSAIQKQLPFHRRPDEVTTVPLENELRIAIIGRPNVGKSSLTNRILGYERSLVSEKAGTTRDTVDTIFQRGSQTYRLIDTAGIRRKGKTFEGAEKLSIVKARQAMARADVSLLLIDPLEGSTHQEAVVAGYAQEAGAAVILVVNKWDLIEKDGFTTIAMEEQLRRQLGFLHHAPLIFISSLTGKRVSALFPLIDSVAQSHRQRISTADLNRFLRSSVAAMNPPTKNSGQITKLYFMTQVGVRPPSFVIKANATGVLHFSYVRFLENRLREQFGFHGTPLRIAVKKKGTREDEAEEVAKVRQVISPKLGIKPSKKTLSHKRKKPRVGSLEKRSPSYRGSLRPRRKKKT